MLHHALKQIARRFPQHIAVAHGGIELSYETFFERCELRARELAQAGARPGDRIAVLAENGADALVLIWAIYRCEAISVVLNDQLKPDALGSIIEDCSASLLICQPARLAEQLADRAICPVLTLVSLSAASSVDSDDRAELAGHLDSNPDRIASIIYTSGSTGTPKGVCLTHTNLLAVADMAAEGYGTGPDDTYLMLVPLHYIHGLMIQLALLLRGARIEFMNSFMFPTTVTRRLKDSKITGFSGVPYHFSALIDRGGFLDADLPSLRWIGVTGGTIPPERLRQIRQAKPEIDIHISYGQTECSPRITLLDPAKIDTKPTSVGSVPNALTVEFLDEDGIPVAPGDVGELVVSGPTVMHGYWNDPDTTAKVIDDQNRLFTGDLAYMDRDGDIFIKGRKQAMIKSAGERIFPEELEALIIAHDSVVDAAVVGISDPLYGQRVEAHVVLVEQEATASLSADDAVSSIRDHCLMQVPFARAPRCFHVWDAFPLKANGKTDKQQLIERCSQAQKLP